MRRIFFYENDAYDLGNIKYIEVEPFSNNSDGCYVLIHLLKGREYVYNAESDATELIEPIIKKGFGKLKYANFFIKSISVEWENYLENNETENPFIS